MTEELKTTIYTWLQSRKTAIKEGLSEDFDSLFDNLWIDMQVHIEDMNKAAVTQAMENIVLQLVKSEQPLSDEFKAALASDAGPSPIANPAGAPSQSTAAPDGDLPWIESRLCTACDECIKINKSIFAYDDNKLAIIKNPAGGPFRDIVKSAEKCSARIIHPGTPLNPNEKGVDKWVKRAEKYQ